jgi:hypothetical protein
MICPQTVGVTQQQQLAAQHWRAGRDEPHQQRKQADVAKLRHELQAWGLPSLHALHLAHRHLPPV